MHVTFEGATGRSTLTSTREKGLALPLGRAAYWLSGSLAAVAAVAASATFFIPGVLRGEAVMNGSARGTALVMLVVAIPVLVLAMWAAARGSVRAQIIWLGAVVYVLYNAVLFALATPFNNLFLFYVATLSLSLWSIAFILRGIGVESFREKFSAHMPSRAIAGYTMAIALLNFLAWMAQVAPGVLSTSSPPFLKGTGLTTSPLYVQDLAVWLPLLAVAAVWLWRRAPWGYVIVGALLTMYEIEAIGVAVDQWMGHAADPASTVASATAVPMFAIIFVIGLIPLFFYFRNLDRGGREMSSAAVAR